MKKLELVSANFSFSAPARPSAETPQNIGSNIPFVFKFENAKILKNFYNSNGATGGLNRKCLPLSDCAIKKDISANVESNITITNLFWQKQALLGIITIMSDGRPMDIGPIKDILPKPQGMVAKPRRPKIEIIETSDSLVEQKIPLNAPDAIDLTDTSTPSDEPHIEIIQVGDSARLADAKTPTNAPENVVITHTEIRAPGIIGFLQKLGDSWRSFSTNFFHQDHFESDPKWWGDGEKGVARMKAHQQETAQMSNNLVEIMEKIELSEIKMSTLPAPDTNPLEEIVITLEETSNLPNARLVSQIQELYGDETLPITAHTLETHNKQDYVGRNFEATERRIYSCTLRSVLNGLDALGISHNVTEEDLIRGFGLNNFTQGGFLHAYELSGLERIVPDVAVLSTPLTTFIEAINVLKNKGVVIFSSANESHSILISGLRNSGNHLEFMINDPFSEKGVWVSAQNLISRHNSTWGTELYGLFNKKDYHRNEQGDIVKISTT